MESKPMNTQTEKTDKLDAEASIRYNGGMKRRGNHTGTLSRKAEGKNWTARWMVNGKLKTKSTGTPDRHKAMKILESYVRPFMHSFDDVAARRKLLLAELEALDGLKKLPELPLSKLVAEFIKTQWEKELEKGTVRLYESNLSGMVTWMKARGCKNASDVSHSLAEEFLREESGRIVANSYNNRLSLYMNAWNSLMGKFKMDKKAWEGFKYKPKEESKRRSLTEDELSLLMSKADSDMKTCLTIQLYTAQRVSDCAILKWEDVDLKSGLIKVVPIKTRKHGTKVEVPIHPQLMKLLEGTPVDGEYVNPNLARWYRTGHLSERYKELFESCGIKTSGEDEDGKMRMYTGSHSIRHTAATNLLEAGATMKEVAEILGHKSVKTTEKYLHANIERMRGVVNKLKSVA